MSTLRRSSPAATVGVMAADPQSVRAAPASASTDGAALSFAPELPQGVIPRPVRWLGLIFGVLASFLLVFCFAVSPASLSMGWAVCLSVSGLAIVAFSTSPKRRFVTPLAFAVFYLLGCLTSFAGIVQDPSGVPRVGFGAIGRFDFTDESLAGVVAVMLTGLVGIVAAVKIAEGLAPRVQFAERAYVPRLPLGVIVVGWAVLSVVLIGTCAALGIGRTGLTNETALPFAIGGLFFYMRNYLLPALGIFVLEVVERSRSTVLLLTVLGLMLAFGAFGAIAALSRSYFALALSPPLLLLLRRGEATAWFRWRAMPGVLVALLASAVVVTAISSLRETGYAAGAMSMSDTAEALQDDPGQGNTSGMKLVGTLATDRIGGTRQLLAVSSCRVRGLGAAWGLVTGDPHWVDRITQDSMGFVPAVGRTKSFGVSYGMWGVLSLTDNLFFVFAGTVLLLLLPLGVEIAFGRFGQRVTGQGVAVILSLMLWSQPALFELSRFAITVLITFGLLLFIAKRVSPPARA